MSMTVSVIGTPPDHPPHISEGTRAVWVSHGYGYGDDFMYFGEIFAALRARLPRMAVVVEQDRQYRNRHAIELLPLIRAMHLKLKRKGERGQSYDTETVIPSPGLFARLMRVKADAFITIEFTPVALMTMMAAKLRDIPTVLLVESDPSARGGSSSRLVSAVKRLAVRCADVIQTNNERGRDYLVQTLGADPAVVRVAPYLTSRPPGPDGDAGGNATGPVRLLFVNGINERKGLDHLLAALALLDDDTRAQISLDVVGDGPDRAACEDQAGLLGMGDRVRFHGARTYDALGPFMAAADVMVVPSLADYRSLVGFEALGYGLALLASSRDLASEETVEEGRNGHVFDPLDHAALAGRIADLANNRGGLEQMRRHSRTMWENRFSLDRIAENLFESLAAVTHASPAHGR